MIGWLTGFHTDVYWVQGEYCQTDTSSLYSFSNKRDRTQLAVGVSKPYTYILGGIVINPFGANIVITLPMLDGLENDCIIKKEEQVLIGIPAEYPTELINNLCIYFDKEKSVDKAFLLWMVRGEEGSYLLILDSKEDPNILYPRIGNFCSRFLKDKMLDIVSANSDFGKNVIKEHKSFYESLLIKSQVFFWRKFQKSDLIFCA